jgi:hypothetical protein
MLSERHKGLCQQESGGKRTPRSEDTRHCFFLGFGDTDPTALYSTTQHSKDTGHQDIKRQQRGDNCVMCMQHRITLLLGKEARETDVFLQTM